MTVWILALVLLASLAAMGYRQGAIRVAFSFVGIIFATLLAGPLSGLFKPLLARLFHNETAAWLVAPLIGFWLVMFVFKTVAFTVHRKVEVRFKYAADDLQYALWERLSRRMGLALGVLNGTAYFVLICFVVFNLSYWTVQIAPSDSQTWKVRLLNRLGHDLESTGMNKAAAAVAAMPENFYKLADLTGLICQNPQVGDRLARYPAFLTLMERDDLKQLAQDSAFTSAWQGSAPIGQMLDDAQVKAILKNNDLVGTIWGILQTNMDDLTAYLKTGQSSKYDPDRLVGFWDFNAASTAAYLPIAQPKISPAEMRFTRLWITNYFPTVLVVAPDHQAYLHNLPHVKSAPLGETATLHLWPIIAYGIRSGSLPNTETMTLAGQWQNADNAYNLSFPNSGKTDVLNAQIKDGRLTVTTSDGDTLVFDREPPI